MLIAANRGMGGDTHFPDICKTPMPPPVGMLPLPYPNIAMNAMAVAFSPNVFWSFVPALTVISRIVMSMGDEPGALGGIISGTIKGAAGVWAGNPIVAVNGMPAKHLLCPTHSNNYNAPIGLCSIPSLTNVLLCERLDRPAEPKLAAGLATTAAATATTGPMSGDDSSIFGHAIDDEVGYLRIARFAHDSSTRIFNILQRWPTQQVWLLDLRGTPGGDARGALELCDDLLPLDTVLGHWHHGDGDELPVRARQADPYEWPLLVLVDERTASAAEIVAATLQHHGRAKIVGEPTWGKDGAHQLLVGVADTAYPMVARWLLPDGRTISAGVQPDVMLTSDNLAPEQVLQQAVALARMMTKERDDVL